MLQLAWNHNTICGALCFSFLFFSLQIQVRLKLSDDAQTSPERVGVGILWTDMANWEVERHCPRWGSRLLIVRTHLFLVLITVLIGPERESVLCAGEHHVVQNTDLINRYRIELHKGSCRVQIDFPKFRQFLQGHDIEGPSQEDPCGRNKTEPTWKNRVA